MIRFASAGVRRPRAELDALVGAFGFGFRSLGSEASEALMPASHVNDSKHWRDRAAQMRALSEMMKDIDAATIMLRLADDYDMLADRADARRSGGGRSLATSAASRSRSWRAHAARQRLRPDRGRTLDHFIDPDDPNLRCSLGSTVRGVGMEDTPEVAHQLSG